MNSFTDGLIVLVAILLIAGFGILGALAVNDTWETDCKLLGVHRQGSAVYECKPRW